MLRDGARKGARRAGRGGPGVPGIAARGRSGLSRAGASRPHIPKSRALRTSFGDGQGTPVVPPRPQHAHVARVSLVFRSCFAPGICEFRGMTGGAVQGQGDEHPRVSDRHTLGPTIARPRLTPNGSKKAGHRAPWQASITDAWGVEPKAGPAGRIGDSRCMKDRKIDAGEAGGSEPPRRLSGRRIGAHCARQCRTKCGRAPQERPHECREHRDRQCAEVGAVADALVRSTVHRR